MINETLKKIDLLEGLYEKAEDQQSNARNIYYHLNRDGEDGEAPDEIKLKTAEKELLEEYGETTEEEDYETAKEAWEEYTEARDRYQDAIEEYKQALSGTEEYNELAEVAKRIQSQIEEEIMKEIKNNPEGKELIITALMDAANKNGGDTANDILANIEKEMPEKKLKQAVKDEAEARNKQDEYHHKIREIAERIKNDPNELEGTTADAKELLGASQEAEKQQEKAEEAHRRAQDIIAEMSPEQDEEIENMIEENNNSNWDWGCGETVAEARAQAQKRKGAEER